MRCLLWFQLFNQIWHLIMKLTAYIMCNADQILKSQNISHISPSWASYGLWKLQYMYLPCNVAIGLLSEAIFSWLRSSLLLASEDTLVRASWSAGRVLPLTAGSVPVGGLGRVRSPSNRPSRISRSFWATAGGGGGWSGSHSSVEDKGND